MLAIDPTYQDAAARLENARHQRAVADLIAEAFALHRAKQWAAVVAVGRVSGHSTQPPMTRWGQLGPGRADRGRACSQARHTL